MGKRPPLNGGVGSARSQRTTVFGGTGRGHDFTEGQRKGGPGPGHIGAEGIGGGGKRTLDVDLGDRLPFRAPFALAGGHRMDHGPLPFPALIAM